MLSSYVLMSTNFHMTMTQNFHSDAYLEARQALPCDFQGDMLSTVAGSFSCRRHIQ